MVVEQVNYLGAPWRWRKYDLRRQKAASEVRSEALLAAGRIGWQSQSGLFGLKAWAYEFGNEK